MTQEAFSFALWLAERWGVDQALVGDLVERRSAGRVSRIWYWRQVLIAVAIQMLRDLAEHKLLAGRALAVGAVAYVLLSFPANWMTGLANQAILTALVRNGLSSHFWLVFWAHALPGRFFVYMASAATGWLVGRLHRPYSMAMVCVFCCALLLFEYGMVAFSLLAVPAAANRFVLFPASVILPVLVLGRPLSALIGGLSASGKGTTQAAR